MSKAAEQKKTTEVTVSQDNHWKYISVFLLCKISDVFCLINALDSYSNLE